jgi:predicted alpha/beta hydrolase
MHLPTQGSLHLVRSEAALTTRPFLLEAADGVALGVTTYEPAGAARATVVVCGATAVPASYYDAFARAFAAWGVRVVTFDYRGIGRSKPGSLRGFQASMTDWALLDARSVLAHVRRRYEGPLVLVGHSFGGQLIGLLEDARDVDGAILVASQLGYVGHWPLWERVKLEVVFAGVMPALTGTFGYLPGWAGMREDLPAGVAEEWSRWCRDPHYLMSEHADARARFARFDRPVLLYSFTDDDYAPPAAVRALVSALSQADLLHRRLHPSEIHAGAIGHFGFFRRRFESPLWREARAFVEDLVDGRPTFRDAMRRAGALITEEEILDDLAYGRA